MRRIPDLNPDDKNGQECCFDTWRFHALFTAHQPRGGRHRGRGQDPPRPRDHRTRDADLKNSALAHLPSAKLAAHAAWLVLAVMAFNLTRAAATITRTALAKATTATIRHQLITVPARVASSARRVTLHLPTA
jgi:hypothetical protein